MKFEIVKFSTSSAASLSLILIVESSQKAVIFMMELLRGQVLSPEFMNSDIIAGLVYEHTIVEPVAIHNLDEKNTSLVFTESKDIENIHNTLHSIQMWLGCSVNIGYDIATPKQVSWGIY